ncbi:MAG: TPM domain-containing protein [Planctomycetota bacterium]
MIPLVQSGVSDAWERGAHPLLYFVAEYGPWVFLALAVVLVLRAIARSRRYRAVSVLDAGAQETLRKEIRDAENRTVGEIVPVVLERSDHYPGATWLAALCTMLLGSALLERHLPWGEPHWLLLCQLGLGAFGFLLASLLPDLQRLFVTEARATEMASEQAIQEFQLLGLRDTRERTGVLIFVSLFEHRVVVLGDAGIHAKVGDAHWEKTRDAVLQGIVRGSLAEGLGAGVRACGGVLAEHFPKSPGDRNEIVDRLIVRRR